MHDHTDISCGPGKVRGDKCREPLASIQPLTHMTGSPKVATGNSSARANTTPGEIRAPGCGRRYSKLPITLPPLRPARESDPLQPGPGTVSRLPLKPG